MKTIEFKELKIEKFHKYGSFNKLLGSFDDSNVKIGERPSEFFRDMALLYLGQSNIASFSLFRTAKREMVIDYIEYHSNCGEALLPLDGDMLLSLAPATPEDYIPINEIEIFYVPKGTIVIINPGVWHHPPFPFKCESLNILITLPMRTYVNDCRIVKIDEINQIRVKGSGI